MRTVEEILSSIFGYHFDNETNKEIAFGLHIKAINEARKETAIEFFKWNARKINSYLDYLQKIKPLVTSNEIEEKLNEFEGATLDRRYDLFIECLETEEILNMIQIKLK